MNGRFIIPATYDYRFVVLSIAVAILASYVALDLARRATEAVAVKRHAWLLAAGAGMGIGVWTTHLVAMIAYRLQAPVFRQVPASNVSLLPTIFTGLTAIVLVLALFLVVLIAERRESCGPSMLKDEAWVLRQLIDKIPDFIFVKDLDSRWVVVNSHMAHVVANASQAKDLVGKTDSDFLPPDLAAAIYADDQNVIRSGNPLCNREETVWDAGGNELYLLTSKVPLHDRKGQVIGIAGIGRDISAPKKIEDTQLDTERDYRAIFESAFIGMFQSTPNRRFLTVNSAMALIFGYDSPQEMIADVDDISQLFFVDQERREELEVLMENIGVFYALEGETIRKDGTRISISLSVQATLRDGAIVRYEGMCEDITERKLLSDQLLQAQKLEAVGQLAAGIAHEINTPIQYIGDNVRFLKKAFKVLNGLQANYDSMLNDAQNSNLSSETIKEVSDAAKGANTVYLLNEIPKSIDQTLDGIMRVTEIVAAMKEFSHPGTKEKVSLDLNHAIQSTITIARNEWKYVAEMETNFDSSMPLIFCQPGELNQAILNLIVNAAHAIADVVPKGSSAKGKIKVETFNFTDQVEIHIHDNGSGIPVEVRTRIFDPFFTTKEIGKGTGQGLAIARSVVVDKHGGTIHFETELGKGTTFIIRLPHDGISLNTKAAPLQGVRTGASETSGW